MWIAAAVAAVGCACAPADRPVSMALQRAADAPAPDPPQRVLLLLVGGLQQVDETTPVLARLARAGSLFPDVVSPSATPPVAAASALTSRWPRDHRLGIDRQRLPAGITTAGRLFQEAGYATAVVACPLLDPGLGDGQGFGTVLPASLPDSPGECTPRPLTSLAEAVEAAGDGPVLGTALLSSYRPALQEPGTGMADVDTRVGEFLRRMDAWTDPDTLTVVAGLPTSRAGSLAPLRGAVLHVVMIVHRPGLAASPPIPETHSLVDLLPTLADLSRLEIGDVVGQSLIPVLADPRAPGRLGFRRRPAFAEAWTSGSGDTGPRLEAAAIVHEGWKLIRRTASGSPGSPGGLELYDHVSDPDNREDIVDRHPRLVRRLAALLDRWDGAPRSPAAEPRTDAVAATEDAPRASR